MFLQSIFDIVVGELMVLCPDGIIHHIGVFVSDHCFSAAVRVEQHRLISTKTHRRSLDQCTDGEGCFLLHFLGRIEVCHRDVQGIDLTSLVGEQVFRRIVGDHFLPIHRDIRPIREIARDLPGANSDDLTGQGVFLQQRVGFPLGILIVICLYDHFPVEKQSQRMFAVHILLGRQVILRTEGLKACIIQKDIGEIVGGKRRVFHIAVGIAVMILTNQFRIDPEGVLFLCILEYTVYSLRGGEKLKYFLCIRSGSLIPCNIVGEVFVGVGTHDSIHGSCQIRAEG